MAPDSLLTPDMRLAIALSVDRQALVTQQANWALASVQVATSHIYAQGQSGYHVVAHDDARPRRPERAPTTSTSTSTTVIGQGGASTSRSRPSPTPGGVAHGGVGVLPDGTG